MKITSEFKKVFFFWQFKLAIDREQSEEETTS